MHGESPLVRQWILLKTLCARPGGATVKELTQELGVSEKTVRRDLETFQKVGFPLREEVGAHGRKAWRLQPTAGQPGLSFAFDEAISLYLGRRFLEPLAGTVFWEAAQRAFRKIRASLGPGAIKCVDRFAGLFRQTLVGRSDYSRKSELIDDLVAAAEDCRAVFITYQSQQATEPVSYDIYPYGLIYHRESLYLVGYAPDHNEVRHWKVDRIEAAEVTPVHFQRPDDFDLERHLADSFGIFQGKGNHHVQIRFSREVARYVEEKSWHPSQQLARQPDGTLLAEFDLSSTEEIKRWVLSFGKEAEVLEPEELRREMAEELTATVAAYSVGRVETAKVDTRRRRVPGTSGRTKIHPTQKGSE